MKFSISLFLFFFSHFRGAKKIGKKSRVVSVSSTAHFYSNIIFEDPNFEKTPYNEMVAYGQAKTANSLFSVGLTEKYASEGVVSNALHPGVIFTGLYKFMTPEDLKKQGWMKGRTHILIY